VLVDPGLGIRQLGVSLGEAEPAAFIGIPQAQLAARLLGWARQSVRTRITVGPRRWFGLTLEDVRRAGAGRGPFAAVDPAPTETAALLFTSGSTGPAKGAVYTHGIFAAQVEAVRNLYGIEPGEVDLPTFPLFALFGPALGMTCVVPDMDFTRPARVDPRKLVRTVEDFGVTNMFGSPAVIRRLGSYGAARGVRLPSLRRVISAGAPVPAAAIETFTRLLAPGVQVFTPYGATECLPVASIGSDEILGDTRRRTDQGAGVCVGRPVPGLRVEVIRITDEPIPTWDEGLVLPPGQIGEVVVQGPLVTSSYFNRPAATALAKMADSGGVFHRMGDLGYFDDCGRLWFCGRKSQRVRTAAGELYTIPCEGIFNTHPAVFRTALVGVPGGDGSEPVLCVELEPGQQPTEALRRELLELGARFAPTRAVRRVLFHPGFPVDVRHNAKIFREKLAVWAAGQRG
jgi:acyl-CoA synthetase (AMP-forming)/AMP-acid ligase II